MIQKENNFAFIDGQNLNLGIRSLGWKLDFFRFRKYLAEKYSITTAYYFIGYMPGNQPLYSELQKAGYVLIFKPTIPDSNGHIKGNIDADLVLQTMIDFPSYDKAIIVSGDGDFYCLLEYLEGKGKLLKYTTKRSPRTRNSILCSAHWNLIKRLSTAKPSLSSHLIHRTQEC